MRVMAYKEVESIIKKLDDEMKSESKAWSDYDKSMIDIGLRVAIDIIKEQPTADVVEVKHGEWLPDYETFVDEWERESEPIQTGWVCSLCGRQEFNREPYCHCGAKMDGGKEE